MATLREGLCFSKHRSTDFISRSEIIGLGTEPTPYYNGYGNAPLTLEAGTGVRVHFHEARLLTLTLSLRKRELSNKIFIFFI